MRQQYGDAGTRSGLGPTALGAMKEQERSLVTALAMKPCLDAFAAERRRHARVKVCLTGQFMRENRKEFPCSSIDISVGGVAFAADEEVELGEKIIAYVAQLGRIQGVVRRRFAGGFAIAMSLPSLKRDKLADQLTWIANRHDLGMPEDRRHERIIPRNPNSTLELPSGVTMPCKIIDLSRSGVAIAVLTPPAIGASVVVGRSRGQVVREFPAGVAVEFARIISAEAFSADYRP